MFMFKNPNNSSSLFPVENFFGDINNILYNSEVIISWADENMCFLYLFNNLINSFSFTPCLKNSFSIL